MERIPLDIGPAILDLDFLAAPVTSRMLAHAVAAQLLVNISQSQLPDAPDTARSKLETVSLLQDIAALFEQGLHSHHAFEVLLRIAAKKFFQEILVNVAQLHARQLTFQTPQVLHPLHQIHRLLELQGSLAAKETPLAAQPVFQLADLLQLHHQLLELFLGVGIFEAVRSQFFNCIADFARQIVQKLLFFLGILTGLVQILLRFGALGRRWIPIAPALRPSRTGGDTHHRVCAFPAPLGTINRRFPWSVFPLV